ncbi:BnaCnng36330D [Brassica napus]|uniref:BnaCnng36330D protein n=1 Tax=Brassica napus TaxID=3708 RepID=A0A078J3J9_BRANA|nr:BnaCnng36330D [Brassica napus]
MSEFYNLKGLNDDETLELFTRCAFGNIVIEENLMDLSKKEIQSSMKMVEMVSTLPDVCEVLIAENNYIRLIPYEEYNEAQENKEFQSDNDGVLATRDTDLITLTTSDLCSKSYPQKSLRARLYNRFSKSIPRNLRLYRLDYNSMIRSLSEHFQKHHVLVQGVSSQLQKLSQSFSNSRDHDLLEQNLQRLLTLSGGCDRIKRVLDFLRKIRELNRKGEEN